MLNQASVLCPPEKAREYISSSAGLITVATPRDRLERGEFIMPSAVREEISIAYGLGKSILIVGETSVRFDGFMNNYCTRLPFSRDDLVRPGFIGKLANTIFTFRQELAKPKLTHPSTLLSTSQKALNIWSR